MRTRSASFLVLLTVLLAMAPGCGLYYGIGKFTGLISPPTLSTKQEVPADFKLGFSARDVVDPPIDYTISFERSGRAVYDVTVRSPRRRQAAGEFEITEDQVVGLWKAVQESKFDELDERYPSSGDGKDKAEGVQTFYVFANNAEWRVEAHYQLTPEIKRVRDAARAVVREDIMQVKAALNERPKEFIGDSATHVFHLPDCSQLKDVPEQQRQSFHTSFDALNFYYQPCPECRPMKTK